MAFYQRMTMVKTEQFSEERYLKDRLSYPGVWDKVMFSGAWLEKSAKDGRYYITNQRGDVTEYITIFERDYIIREGMGIAYTIPKDVFEENFEKLHD